MEIFLKGKLTEIDAFMAKIQTQNLGYKTSKCMEIITETDFNSQISVKGTPQAIRGYFQLEDIIMNAEELQKLCEPIKELLARFNTPYNTVEITSQRVRIIRDESNQKRNNTGRKE